MLSGTMEHGMSTSHVRLQLRRAARTQAKPTAQHVEVEVGRRPLRSNRGYESEGQCTHGIVNVGWTKLPLGGPADHKDGSKDIKWPTKEG